MAILLGGAEMTDQQDDEEEQFSEICMTTSPFE